MGRAQGKPEKTPLGAIPLTPALGCGSPSSRKEVLEGWVPKAGAFSQEVTLCPCTARGPPACLPDGSCWATRPAVLFNQTGYVKMNSARGKKMQSNETTFFEED